VKAVRRTLQVMQRCGTTPSGLVLNCLPERSGYGYYYYYHYGSKDGYYSKGVYGFEGDEKSSKKNGKAKLHAANGAVTASSRMVTTGTSRSDKPGVWFLKKFKSHERAERRVFFMGGLQQREE
jgi:hypothetical protein